MSSVFRHVLRDSGKQPSHFLLALAQEQFLHFPFLLHQQHEGMSPRFGQLAPVKNQGKLWQSPFHQHHH